MKFVFVSTEDERDALIYLGAHIIRKSKYVDGGECWVMDVGSIPPEMRLQYDDMAFDVDRLIMTF